MNSKICDLKNNNKKMKKTSLILTIALVLLGSLGFAQNAFAVNDSIYSVTETTATVGTATNLEFEYTVDTASQTWANSDTLTLQLPASFPIWSSLTFTAEYDSDATNNGVGETPITAGGSDGQYALDGARTITIKWNATGWGAVVDEASTIRILVTGGAIPAYAETATFTFAGLTAAADTDPTGTDTITVSAADPDASIVITANDQVGEGGTIVATLDIDYAMADTDEIRFTFPANFDVSAASLSAETVTGSFGVCTIDSQTVKCPASGGIGAQNSVTMTLSGIKVKYAADASTYTTTIYDISESKNIATASDTIGATYAATTLTATNDASATDTVGEVGVITSAITFPVALVATDTIKFTFPQNYDISGLTTGSQAYGLTGNVTVAKTGQIVTLTLEAGQAAGLDTITFPSGEILSKYAWTASSTLILIEKSTGQDVVAASADTGVLVAIDATVAADPNSIADATAIAEINDVGNVIFTFDVDYAMVSGDTVLFTLPVNYNVASAAWSSDTFAGGDLNFSACTGATQTITCTVGATGLPKVDGGSVTLSGITAITAGTSLTYTTTLYDTSAGANIAYTVTPDTIDNVVADTTAPTVTSWTLDMDTGVAVINFSEAMDTTVTPLVTKMSIKETTNASLEGTYHTLTNSTPVWTNSTRITITLSSFDLTILKDDAGLAEAVGSSFLEIVSGSLITDNATGKNALSLTNVAPANSLQVTSHTPDATIPTITSIVGTSITNAGDTIVITFSEPMDETTLTEGDVQGGTVLGLDYSDNAGDTNEANIVTTTATAVWSASSTVLTITLNEGTDGAYIPSGKYIGATSDGSIQDMATNAVAVTEIYSAIGVTAEVTQPTISSVVGTSITNAGDTIAITFSEPMTTTTLDVDNLVGVTSITDSAGGAFNLTSATGLWSGGKTIYTITLNETTDFDYIRNGSTVTVVLPATVTDLVGNAISGTGVSAAVTKEATIPTISTIVGASVNAAGDTIAITFSEPMATTTITTALLQANTNITLNYSDDGTGLTNPVDMRVGHATVAWTGLTVATITLDEETDVSYIPDGKYIGVTLASVTDLAGNAEAGVEIVSTAGVSDEDVIPTYTVTAVSNDNAGDTVLLTFNEVMATSTLSASTGITSITGSIGGAYTLDTDTGSWSANGKVYTVTLNEATDGAFIRDTETVTVVLAGTVVDLNGNAEAGVGVASGAITKEAGQPTISSVVGTSITAVGDTIAITFSEPMDTTTLSASTGITSITDSAGGAFNLANDTGSWTGKTVYTVTLNEATDFDFIRDGSTVTVVLAGTVTDLVGNAISGGGADATVPKEDTAPTISSVVGTSVDKAGDTIAITFSEVMATSTLTALTGITSITGSVGGAYTLANDTGVWSGTGGMTVYTVTLNEAIDGSYIRDGESVTVVLAATVTDLVGNAISGGGVDAAVAKESTAPTLSITAASVNAGGDTVTITSDEVLSSTATTIGNWTVQYDDNGAGLNIQTLSLANATVAFTDATKLAVIITLDEITDGSAIPSSKYVKVTPHATNIKDLVGNAAVAAAYSAAVTSETTVPTISAVSVADAATSVAVDTTITATFSEALRQDTVNGNTVKLYVDVGNNDAVNIGTDTEVSASVTLENNGASTKIYIDPTANLSNSENYIYRISTGVKDLAGNALAANGDYDFTTVASSADVTAPTANTQSPVDGATSVAITVLPTVTFSENMATSSVNTNTVQLKLASDDSVVPATVTYASMIATIHPASSLTNNVDYWIWTSGATDVAGNYMTASTTESEHTFTTVALANGTLALTVPIVASSTRTYATADDTYENGWAWDFYVTVPTTETSFQIKFSDWQGGSTMLTANNMRIYSAQASASTSPSTAGTIYAANTYSPVMALTGELTASQAAAVGIADPATLPGRQIKVTVETKVPATVTSGGSYSTSYQIHSEQIY